MNLHKILWKKERKYNKKCEMLTWASGDYVLRIARVNEWYDDEARVCGYEVQTKAHSSQSSNSSSEKTTKATFK